MPQVMESKARPVLHKLSSCHQQDIGEEAAREEEGVEAAFALQMFSRHGND